MKLKLAAAGALVLSACGTSQNIVATAPTETVRVRAFHIEHVADTVYVEPRLQDRFHSTLANEFYRNAGFSYGHGVTARYRFIGINEGNRFARFLAGGVGNVGQSAIIIQTDFIDEHGEVLASIQTEGEIDSGFLGGSMSSAMERAAEEITDYARANFYYAY